MRSARRAAPGRGARARRARRRRRRRPRAAPRAPRTRDEIGRARPRADEHDPAASPTSRHRAAPEASRASTPRAPPAASTLLSRAARRPAASAPRAASPSAARASDRARRPGSRAAPRSATPPPATLARARRAARCSRRRARARKRALGAHRARASARGRAPRARARQRVAARVSSASAPCPTAGSIRAGSSALVDALGRARAARGPRRRAPRRRAARSASLREPRVDVAAQRDDLEVRPRDAGAARARRRLPVPTRAPGAQRRRAVAPRARRRARRAVGALGERGERECPPASSRGQVLRAVHGEVGAPVEQRLLDLLHEEPLAADRRERHVVQAVARRCVMRTSSVSRAERALERRATSCACASASGLARVAMRSARHGSSGSARGGRLHASSGSGRPRRARRARAPPRAYARPSLAVLLRAQPRDRRVQDLVDDARASAPRAPSRCASARPSRASRALELAARGCARRARAGRRIVGTARERREPAVEALRPPRARSPRRATFSRPRSSALRLGDAAEVVDVVEVDVVELVDARVDVARHAEVDHEERAAPARRAAPRSTPARAAGRARAPPMRRRAPRRRRAAAPAARRGRGRCRRSGARAPRRARGVRFAMRTRASAGAAQRLERQLDHLARADQQRASCPRGSRRSAAARSTATRATETGPLGDRASRCARAWRRRRRAGRAASRTEPQAPPSTAAR